MTWATGPFLGFDTETTGVDVENDRIVTAAVIDIRPGEKPRTRDWLINPGVEIPAGASAVHGISTQQAKELGAQPEVALTEIAALVCMAFRTGTPIVAMNATFDLTLLDRELIRYGLGGLAERLGGYEAIRPVLDPFVMDRKVDPFRRGKRNLGALCEHYGVVLGDAHEAAADAIGACRVLFKLATRYPDEIGNRSIDTLHDLQIKWHATKQAELAAYFRQQNRDASSVDGSWPIRPMNSEAAA